MDLFLEHLFYIYNETDDPFGNYHSIVVELIVWKVTSYSNDFMNGHQDDIGYFYQYFMVVYDFLFLNL